MLASLYGLAMSSLTFSVSSGTRFSQFQWPAWLGLAAIVLSDAIWAGHLGLHVIVQWRDFNLLAILVVAFAGFRSFGLRRAALIAEFLALSVAISLAFTVFCYLAFGSSGALVDKQLLAADRALGFNWLAGFKTVAAHPLLADILRWLYDSLNWQALYVCVLLGLMDRQRALQEMFWLVFVSAVMTNVIAVAIPAYGPFEVFGLASHGSFLPDMIHLKSGQDLTFALSKMTGVISFPSYHTVLALSYAWCLRRTGIVGYLAAAINFVMLFSIPFFGGHYLVDLIAGGCVMLLSLGIVKICMVRFAPLARASALFA